MISVEKQYIEHIFVTEGLFEGLSRKACIELFASSFAAVDMPDFPPRLGGFRNKSRFPGRIKLFGGSASNVKHENFYQSVIFSLSKFNLILAGSKKIRIQINGDYYADNLYCYFKDDNGFLYYIENHATIDCGAYYDHSPGAVGFHIFIVDEIKCPWCEQKFDDNGPDFLVHMDYELGKGND